MSVEGDAGFTFFSSNKHNDFLIFTNITISCFSFSVQFTSTRNPKSRKIFNELQSGKTQEYFKEFTRLTFTVNSKQTCNKQHHTVGSNSNAVFVLFSREYSWSRRHHQIGTGACALVHVRVSLQCTRK